MTQSVGSVQFDVEFAQESVKRGLNEVSQTITSGIKSALQSQVGGLQSTFKNMFSGLGTESDKATTKATTSVNKMTQEFDKTSNAINKVKSELSEIYAELDRIQAAQAKMPPISGLSADESMAKGLSGDKQFQDLSAKASQLEAELAKLTARNKEVSASINESGKAAEETGNKFSFFKRNAEGGGRSAESASRKTRLFGNSMQQAGNQSRSFADMIRASFGTIMRRLFVYQVMMKGIRGIMNHTWAALQTNDQFMHSLHQIQGALATAFMPIYNAVLPALNALMSAVATVTTYIAAAISALFGGTLKKSFGQAKKMNSGIKAMKNAGGAASGAGKKAKKAGKDAKKGGKDAKAGLMAFDEINAVATDDASGADKTPSGGGAGAGGGGGAGGFEMPDSLAEIDMAGIEKFKEIMGQIFEPFILAWENEGQNTIDAFKYALEEIKLLTIAIGKSWLEVWTNGTGQAILEAMLRIIQQIFFIVGDIAKAIRMAWEENEAGTKMIQAMADAYLAILELIEQIAISWREAWNDGTGQQIVSNILSIITNIATAIGGVADSFKLAWTEADRGTNIFTNINTVFEVMTGLVKGVTDAIVNVWGRVGNDVARTFVKIMESTTGVLAKVAEALKSVWDNGGQRVFEGLIELGAKIFELAGYIYTEFVAPFIEWFIDLITPAIEDVMNAVGFLLEKFTELIDWLLGDGKPALDVIITVLESLALAFGVVKLATVLYNGVVAIFNGVIGIATGVTKAFGVAMAFITSPIGLVVLAIAAAIAIGVTLYKNWDKLKDGIAKIWDNIKQATEKVWNAIKDFFQRIWDRIKRIFTRGNKDTKEDTAKSQEEQKKDIEKKWGLIGKFLNTNWSDLAKNAKEKWENIKTNIDEKVDNAKESINKKWTDIKSKLGTKWDEIKTSASEKWQGIKGAIDEKVDNAKTSVSKKWDDIKENTSTKWDSIKTNIASKKDAIKEAMLSGFEAADKSINGILKNAKNWGVNLMSMFSDGIKSKINAVKDAATRAANAVKDKLGFESPTFDGPAKDSDKWAPNFMDMFAEGIEDNINKVAMASSHMAMELKPHSSLADNMASAVGSAVLQANQFTESNRQRSNQDIVIEIDGREMARVVNPELQTERKRRGRSQLKPI